ncbi:MAG: tyrosine-type recombinase/integrase [Gemmatimonadales bacterium]|nr:tyrosine-type recombinase/integrase [Gemmatimonadales bacterium]
MSDAFSYTAGERSRNRVRVFAHWRTGGMYAEWREGGVKKRISLQHKDAARAKQFADEAAARLGAQTGTGPTRPTLGQLFDIYLATVTPTKAAGTQSHDRTTLARFLAHVGTSVLAESIIEDHARTYLAARKEQGNQHTQRDTFRPLSDRSLDYDLRTLKAVFAWAERTGRLQRNPLRSVTVKRTSTIHRPPLTHDEYRACCQVAEQVGQGCPALLVLAWETGHRIGAIRQLRWEDVQLDAGTARWTAAHDKTRTAHQTPLSPEAVEALRQQRRAVGSIGRGWVFPSPTDPTAAISRNLVRDYWVRLEEKAGIARVQGRGWHSIRRSFSLGVRHLPLKDAMQLGGWKDVKTFVETYQPVDMDQLRTALAGRRSA